MRASSAILTILALIAGLVTVIEPAAAGPPPPGGSTARTVYLNASCQKGFLPNPATYPATAQDVKYQCLSGVIACPSGYDLDQSSAGAKFATHYVHFYWQCTNNGAVKPSAGAATCSMGLRGDPDDPNYAKYFCFVNLVPSVSCPGFNLITNPADVGVQTAMPLRFFYSCIS